MPTSRNNSVRLVVQAVAGEDSSEASYRVLVYPRRKCMRDQPATFESRRELMRRLQAAIPSITASMLTPADESTQIVFARELELTDAQLAILGLTR
jgi:hypothetical protein